MKPFQVKNEGEHDFDQFPVVKILGEGNDVAWFDSAAVICRIIFSVEERAAELEPDDSCFIGSLKKLDKFIL